MKKKNYIKPETNSVAIQAQTFFGAGGIFRGLPPHH